MNEWSWPSNIGVLQTQLKETDVKVPKLHNKNPQSYHNMLLSIM